MEFEFVGRKNAGGRNPSGVDFAAIRLSRCKGDEGRLRVYVAINHHARKMARLVDGDRIVIGVNADASAVCVKLDTENGLTLSASKKNGRLSNNATMNFSVSTHAGSRLLKFADRSSGA